MGVAIFANSKWCLSSTLTRGFMGVHSRLLSKAFFLQIYMPPDIYAGYNRNVSPTYESIPTQEKTVFATEVTVTKLV